MASNLKENKPVAPKREHGMLDLVRNIYESIRGRPATSYAFGSGPGGSPNTFPDLAHPTDEIYKSVIPNFLYKPAFGYPLNKDVPEIRRLAKTPYVAMVVNTICDEVASLDWEIKVRDGKEKEVPDSVIEEVENFFYNPNINDESLEQVLRKGLRDLLELDAMVLNKIFNMKGDFIGVMAYDGGTFTKNPDIHGVMPQPDQGPAYFQYGWSTGARPIPFNKDEIIYIMRNPRADSIYGMSPLENILRVVQMLQYGIDSNLEYFTDNQIPKGFFKMVGATQDDIKAFYQAFSEVQKKRDEAGNYRKIFYKMPVINTEGSFEKVSFSNVELELIAQQQWFAKLVWANFGINPSELGFTEDSNRATEMVQSGAFKRKAIKPIVNLLEYYFNTEIVNQLPCVKGKYEDKIMFSFDKYDVADELANRQVYWGDIQNRLRPVNEIREDLHLEPLPGGDSFEPAYSSTSDALGLAGNNSEDAGSNSINAEQDNIKEQKARTEIKTSTSNLEDSWMRNMFRAGVEASHIVKEFEKIFGRKVPESQVRYTLLGPMGFGWGQKSEEFKTETSNHEDQWMRDSFRNGSEIGNIVKEFGKLFGRKVPDSQVRYTILGSGGFFPGSKADELKPMPSDAEFDKEKLAVGANVELEHTEDYATAEKIAKAHLLEDPDYYLKLAKMESKDYNTRRRTERDNKADEAVEKKKATNGLQQVDTTNMTYLRVVNSTMDPDSPEVNMVRVLDSSLNEMMIMLQKQAGDPDISTKAIDDNFIKNLITSLSFDTMKYAMDDFLKHWYYKGIDKAEEKMLVNTNFVPNEDALNFLRKYGFGLIQDLGQETKNDLRAELERGVMNGEGPKQLAKRIQAVMEVTKERALTIARTEGMRAENAGTLEGYRQSGLKGSKKFIAKIDEKTSPICRALNGSVVPLNGKFRYKDQEFDYPPCHPNCRSTISFVGAK